MIHDSFVMVVWPGTDPILDGESRSAALIESAVARPLASAFGQDLYPTLTEKGVALFHSLIANHPFWNGNKRTAVLAFSIFMAANGHVVLIPNEDMYRLAEKTASYKARGLSQAECLAEITAALQGRIATFEEIEEAQAEEPSLAELYENSLTFEAVVRKFPGNAIAE